MKNKKKRAKFIVLFVLLAFLTVFVYFGFSDKLVIRRYEINSAKITEPIRIVQISDFHSCFYGLNVDEMIEAINNEEPDLIVLTGDIFDDEINNDNTEILIARITGRYPVLYISGNHEAWAGKYNIRDQKRILANYGVVVLDNDYVDMAINGQKVRIFGIRDQAFELKKSKQKDVTYELVEGQLEILEPDINTSVFEILLAHRPDYTEHYAELPFDLILSGHTHGGVARIPYLVNGFYAWGQGWFPKWSGGYYRVNEITELIISRGLSRESSGARFYNPPELVVIDIV